MGQERTNYRYDAILIEASRILSPQFDMQGIWLSGAQVELLRNTMAVLNNPKTFVDEYQDDYYLTATDNDWDTIRATVADLERKLMGNDNVLWGYNDRLLTMQTHIMIAPGTFVQSHDTCPSGEAWVIEGVSIGTSHTGATVYPLNYVEAVNYAITEVISPIVNTWAVRSGLRVVLSEGDGIRFAWGGVVVDQNLTTFVWGYKMKVPA